MTKPQQPEALRLANWLEADIPPNDTTIFADVAKELRRLHKENKALRDRLAPPTCQENRHVADNATSEPQ